MHRQSLNIRSSRGFTLLEFVVVIALAAAVMAGVAALINKGSDSGAYNEIQTEYQKVITGLAEMNATRGGLPCNGTDLIPLTGASVASYFPASVKGSAILWYLRTSNEGLLHPFFYSSSNLTSDQVIGAMDKLKAAGICNASSYAALSGGVPYHVCWLPSYEGKPCR